MANKVPLVFDAATSKIEELPAGDNLNLVNSSVVDAINISATGTITAPNASFTNLTVNNNPIAEVAKTNNYNDLDNLPNLFDGDYNNLTNKPSAISADWADVTNKPTIASKLSQLVNDTNFVTNAQISIQSAQVSGLSTIATTGSWQDLIDKNQLVTKSEITGGTLTIDVNNTGDLEGSVYSTDGNTLLVDGVNKIFNGSLVGNVTGNVTGNLSGETTGAHIGDVYAGDGTKQVLFSGTQTTDALFRGNVSGQLFSPDLSTLLVDGEGNFYGDLKGSVFGDDSSIIVDGLSHEINASNVYATTHWGNLSKTGSILSVTGDNGIQLLPSGVFNVPNATTIAINATDTIGITATNNLTLSSSSGIVDVQGHISIADLKTLVAASADFADFQSRIAAL